mmetsp:Transcript_21064/g.50781  ORF Transcript_21064/g.50781 Transcript_21064/m.50781 type:complete len:241 (+) Transcript_21064:208-930(+)
MVNRPPFDGQKSSRQNGQTSSRVLPRRSDKEEEEREEERRGERSLGVQRGARGEVVVHRLVHLVGRRGGEAPSGGPGVHLEVLGCHRCELRLVLWGVERDLEVGGVAGVAPSVVGQEPKLHLHGAHVTARGTKHVIRLDPETLRLEDLGDRSLCRRQEQGTLGGTHSQLVDVRRHDLRSLDGRLGVGVGSRDREDSTLEAGGAAVLDQADLDHVVHRPQVGGDDVGEHSRVCNLGFDHRR